MASCEIVCEPCGSIKQQCRREQELLGWPMLPPCSEMEPSYPLTYPSTRQLPPRNFAGTNTAQHGGNLGGLHINKTGE